MSQMEIIEEIRKLPIQDRVRVAEATIKLIGEDLVRRRRTIPDKEKIEQQMERAAELLKDDHAPGGELTEFTALDAEDFYDEK